MWFFKKKKAEAVLKRNMVSVRMEAVGGQGANSAGKILAESAVLKAGYTGNHFSSFGSEKRGTPVKSFVRFSTERAPVRTASHIQHPDILMIFHESLLSSHPEVLSGVTETTDLIINTAKDPEELKFPEKTKLHSIVSIDATKIALKVGCGLNAVMLGALTDFCQEVSKDDLKLTLEEFFSKKKSHISKNNLNGFDEGQSKYKVASFRELQANLTVDNEVLPTMGWMNSPIGGVITHPGNSVLKDHSASRKGIAPKLIKEICFNCGFCDMVCPDFCFVWDLNATDKNGPQLKGIDYQYCKGCQKCVAVCPVEALVPVVETDITLEERQHKAFPELNKQSVKERWAHLDWVTYVDQLTDEEKMLTLQTELLDPKTYLRPEFSQEILSLSKKESSK